MDNPEIRRVYAGTAVKSYRQGERANVEEALLLAKPWPFRAEDIALGRVYLWHGERDRLAPVGPARLLARALPGRVADLLPRHRPPLDRRDPRRRDPGCLAC